MTGRRVTLTLIALAGALLAAVPGAAAAVRCEVPQDAWKRADPLQVGLDPDKLRAAVDAATGRRSFSVRVYRYGCLVAEDALADANRNAQFESWSMAKSVTSMVFGRAMSMGLISPDDPLGALLPEADQPHGAVTMRDLLTMTSGLHWNGFRDYDILMPDRIHDALTTPIERPPGTFYEYSQSGPALLAKAVERAVGMRFEDFAQQELFGRLGIQRRSWYWRTDAVGNNQGFYGLNMRPADYARLGELMRRGGAWRGRRILQRRYVREAVRPTATNPGYGWMFWLNRGDWYIGPRVQSRPVYDHRMVPGIPADMYQMSGLFDQRVTVFPSQELLFVRNGTSAGEGVNLAGGGNWEAEIYGMLMDAVIDEPVPPPPAEEQAPREATDPDRGFQTSLFEPGEYGDPFVPESLPPAGPARARAVRLRIMPTVSKRRARVRVTCVAGARKTCEGPVRLALPGLRRERSKTFSVDPGAKRIVRFRVPRSARHAIRRGRRTASAVAVNRDEAQGTRSQTSAKLLLAGRRR